MVLLLLMFPFDAAAKKIYSPIVEQGDVEFEYLLDVSFDGNADINGRSRHQVELEYGVTERWLTAIYGDFDKLPGQSFRYRGMKWENIYQLFGKGERWLDAGLYLEYIAPAASRNKPDVIELKLLLEKEAGTWLHTANVVLKKEMGVYAGRALATGYAWRSRWQWKRGFEPAVEYYASLGEVNNTKPLSLQSHQMGPVIHGHLPGDFSYELGYLFGLTSTSGRGMLKLILAYEL